MNNFLIWAPRVIIIVIILFFTIWGSIEISSPELSLYENLFSIIAHMLPALLFLIVLVLSWKNGIIGGIFFITVGLFYYFTLFGFSIQWDSFFTIAAVLPSLSLLAGFLFIINWYKKKS